MKWKFSKPTLASYYRLWTNQGLVNDEIQQDSGYSKKRGFYYCIDNNYKHIGVLENLEKFKTVPATRPLKWKVKGEMK